MSTLEGFVGVSNTLSSINANMVRSINLLPERADPNNPKQPVYLRKRPGLRRFLLANEAPIRGMFYQDGRMFAVTGSELIEVYENGTFDVRGTVSTSGVSGGVGDSASFSSNGSAGNQLFITAGGEGYIYNLALDTLTHITDPDFLTPTYMGVFIDGYFVSLHALTRQFQISALEDGLTWDGLDVFEISRTSDNLVSMAQSHGQLWLHGSKTTDVWADVGQANTPFQPATGGFLEVGNAAPYSIANLDQTIFWLGCTADGAGFVYRADGYQAQRISDQGIETRLWLATRLDNAIGFTINMQGHPWYLLYVPDLTTTLVYDVVYGGWHEWAWWKGPGKDESDFRPFVGRNHAFAFGKHYVGDRQSRAIYWIDWQFGNDVITECSS